jgi:hypothetical protein
MILNQNSPEVKRTLLEKPSDYRSKSIEEADRGQLMTAQLNLQACRFRADYDFLAQGTETLLQRQVGSLSGS